MNPIILNEMSDKMILDEAFKKREAVVKLVHSNKRFKREGLQFLQLPLEIIQHIFSYTTLRSYNNSPKLNETGPVSKKWREISGNMPYWVNLYKHLKLEKTIKETAKNCFLQAIKENNELALSTPAHDFCESKEIYLSDAVNAFEEFHMLKALVQSNSIKEKLQNKIKYLTAIRDYRQATHTPLMNVMVYTKLVEIKNLNISPTISSIATICLTSMLLNNRYGNGKISNGTVLSLENIQRNETVAKWVHIESQFLLAILKLKNARDSITFDEAIKNLQCVAQNDKASLATRKIANFHVAVARVNKNTHLITDDEAVIFFENISKDVKNSLLSRTLAKFSVAKMAFQKRTDKFSDEFIFETFQYISTDTLMPQYIQNEAEYYMREMNLLI